MTKAFSKRFLLAWLLVAITLYAMGALLGMLVDGNYLATYYAENPAIWKDPMLFSWLPVVSVLEAFFLVFLYNKCNCGCCQGEACECGCGAKHAILFALMLAFFISAPGMLMTYISMQIPVVILVAWVLESLVSYAVAGFVLGMVLKK